MAGIAAAQSGGENSEVDLLYKYVGPIASAEQPRPERFREYLLATAGPVPLVGEALGAGIGQWTNSPKEWGQGWEAYGKRYGSNLAYNGIRQTITFAGSVALDEDTRYFASGAPGVGSRLRHALVSTFTARHRDGRTVFSISNTTGVIGASAISNIWGPPSWKGGRHIAQNAGISFGTIAITNVVREFLPDLLHRPRR